MAKAMTEVGDLRQQKFSVKASLQCLSDQDERAREEASRLSSKLDVVWAEQVEVVDRAAAAEEELVAFRFEIEALSGRGVDPETSEESSRIGFEVTRGEVSALQEQVTVLSSRESELLAGSETARVETELEESWVERLQVVSPQGGDALSLGSISANTRALVIAEYLRSDIHRRCEEFEHSHHSQSGYVKALSEVSLLFPDINLLSLYDMP
ncbi:hypothetical protein ACLOJK_028718 [Asimina triloba]